MEDAGGESVTSAHDAGGESVTSPAGQTGKSKLDTLSKEDLIKFAKKQMVAMQRMKSKCTDLEKEVEVLKHPASGTDSSVIQELSERMNAVLLEKAESQQSLALLRKEHEEFKKQAQETVERLAALQEELDLRNREYTEMQKSTAELTASFKAACTEYESKISQTQEELQEAKHQWTAATNALKESHQMSLTESQQETENLQREIERLNKQYEDDVRYLEEQMEMNSADFERERERLLLLQDELSEQLALNEGFLQDVQEEEEDRAGPPKQQSADFPASDDSSDEGGVLKLALEDLQSQNMMFQEELMFLRNVKVELESELKQVREEFTVEKEELEFRINELQMNRDLGDASVDKCRISEETQNSQELHSRDSKELEIDFSSSAEREQTEEVQHVVDKLQDICSPLPEDECMITHKPVDLQDRTEHFIKQYKAMTERMASSVQGLQEKLESVFQERDGLLEHIRNAEDTLDQAVSVSLEDLRTKTEDILGYLQCKETFVLEFKEMLKFMASESEEHEHKVQLLQVCNLENQLLAMKVEKDERIKTLEEETVGKDERIKTLEEETVGKDERIKTLEEETVGKDERIKTLKEETVGKDERIKTLEEETIGKDERIKTLEEETVGKDERIKTLEEETVGKNERIKTLEEETVGKDERIKTLKEETVGKDERIKTLEEETVGKDERIKTLEEETVGKDECIKTLEEGTVGKDERIKTLEEGTVGKDERIKTLEEETVGKDERIKTLEEETVGKDEHIKTLEEEAVGKDERIKTLEEETIGKDERIKTLEEGTVGKDERIKTLEEEAVGKDERIKTLEEEAVGKDERIKTLEEETVGKDERIKTLEEEAVGKDERVKTLEKDEHMKTNEEEAVEKDERIKALQEELSAFQAKQEECQDIIKLPQSQVVCLSEERNTLRRDMDASQQHLSDVQCHIAEILKQNFPGTKLDGTSDVSTLINYLLAKSQEEKALLSQQCDESVERLTGELESVRQLAEELQERINELLREKQLLKATLEDVVLDTEGLQKDLSEMQAMNEKLRTEVSNLSRSLDEKEPADETDAQVYEANKLQQVLADKDALISQLKEEVGHLQMVKESPVSGEDVKLEALSHELEMLKQASKDKDERMNKIKAVAVKAKKELDHSKKEAVALREEVETLKAERDQLSRSMKDIIHGAQDCKNLMVDYDRQTELLDQEREKLEQANKLNEDLTKRLQNAVQQHTLLSSEREDLVARVETLQSNLTQLESQILETQKLKTGLERDLEAERLVREQRTKDHQSAVQEVEELQAQLSRLKHQLQQTDQELEQLRKGAQQNTLMDMEMADYEKLVKELNLKLSERDRQMEEHQLLIQTQKEREQRLNQEMESLKSLLDQTEEKASRMKQLLVKTKKDLGDAKQKEAAQTLSQVSLRADLEAHQQQLEECKIQCSDLTAERHRLQEQLRQMSEQLQRSSSSHTLRLKALQDESAAAKADLAATVSEFESYKVRVHNVLKQQKHKSSGQSDGEAFRQEREQAEVVLEQMRRRLQETQQSLQSSTAELQQLQTEHDTLLERHNKILQESVGKEAELRERLLSLQSEIASLRSEHDQCAAHLSAQTEALRGSFREQTRHQQDEHCRTVETLQQQISRLETQLFQLQREPASSVLLHQGRKGQADRKSADAPPVDLQGTREEGEGMETTETESLSSTGTPLTSLEQLLTSDLKHEPADWQMEPSKEELAVKLSSAARSVEHLNGLLHETEATNAVLTEQITLLKSEVRRLERNHEREKSVANLEYLKNVLLQFIFLRSGSERQALLPVIHTMLQLSPDEKSRLAAIAHGEEQSAVSRGSGWTSYLHSWSGIR